MCGITGLLHFDRAKAVDAPVLKKMTDTLHYRGPDGEGYHIRQNLGLGHRRLSIIDLSTGDQPMYSEDQSIVLVFNGEIYNYIELKEELKQLGHHFRTHSDTEVIIKAYQQWGVDCQNKFNGMWAFALWDDRAQLLLLSCDRIGEKPLHYTIYNNTLVFGSEIKALFAYGIPRKPDLELLEIFLSLSFIPAPYTFFKNIHKLKPGHCLLVSGDGIKEHQYWELPEIDEQQMLCDKREVYENFTALFTDAVKIRMRSDVPYGAFLSGGLDSSSIVALMSEISSFPVETFTMGFKNKTYDERDLARAVADKFATNHHDEIVRPNVFDEYLNRVVYHYDEPFGDSSAIPTGHVSKFASSKVKMVLTGDGGDEVLSGYTLYQHEKFIYQYQKAPGWMRKGLPSLLSLIPRPPSESLSYKMNRAQLISQSANLDFLIRFLYKESRVAWPTLKEISKNQKVYPVEDYLQDFMQKYPCKDPFYRLMYLNFKLTLPNDMLVKVDRMSMAHSLETRTPFLDHRLVEYMVKVHKRIKMQGLERKTVLRNTLARKLPPQLLNAPKKGFSVPLKKWFQRDSFADRLKNLGKDLPFIGEKTMQSIIETNQSKAGEIKTGNLLWMLFILDKILKQH